LYVKAFLRALSTTFSIIKEGDKCLFVLHNYIDIQTIQIKSIDMHNGIAVFPLGDSNPRSAALVADKTPLRPMYAVRGKTFILYVHISMYII
jgi:acetylornithine/succinyldiaminopimelate/putrescine aminotransferase